MNTIKISDVLSMEVDRLDRQPGEAAEQPKITTTVVYTAKWNLYI